MQGVPDRRATEAAGQQVTRAITLYQPWASLIALGVKNIETRSWPPPKTLIGERLLIHVGGRQPEYGPIGDDWTVCGSPGFPLPGTTFAPLLARIKTPGVAGYYEMPLGAIVASCVLADAVPMVDLCDAGGNDVIGQRMLVVGASGQVLMLTDALPGANAERQDVSDQLPYGDFAPGRWAWLLEDVKPTTERCPACWGEICGRPLGTGYGDVPCVLVPGHGRICNSFAFDDRLEPWCTHCRGLNGCPPIPARGRRRVWNWTP